MGLDFLPCARSEAGRSLKDEVGDVYRVVYEKPCVDPNYRIDERTEILANGHHLPLPRFRDSLVESLRFCECFASAATRDHARRRP